MPQSFRCKLKKLSHDGKIGSEELDELLTKLDGHDDQVREETLNEFQEWLKTQIVGVDNKTKEILVVKGDKWELATEVFKESEKI